MKSAFSRVAGMISLLMLVAVMAASGSAQSGGLKGRVRNTSGRGIPQATVTARQNGADIKSATTDGKGDFALGGLDNGVYNLVFEAKGYSSGILYNVEIKKNRVGDLGERLILSPDQGSLVIVKGSVFFKEGTSIVAAKVELEKVNSDGSVSKLASTTTNLSGEFTFRQPEGQAKLRVTAKYNKSAVSKDIEVSEPAIYRLAITLETSRTEK
jgi:Carboxypeptidase regulatory-like domain